MAHSAPARLTIAHGNHRGQGITYWVVIVVATVKIRENTKLFMGSTARSLVQNLNSSQQDKARRKELSDGCEIRSFWHFFGIPPSANRWLVCNRTPTRHQEPIRGSRGVSSIGLGDAVFEAPSLRSDVFVRGSHRTLVRPLPTCGFVRLPVRISAAAPDVHAG